MRKIVNIASILGVMSSSLLASYPVFSQESGCNVFRYNYGKETGIRVLHSCEYLATGEVGVPEPESPEEPSEPVTGPSEEDMQAWVTFINNNCSNFEGVSYDNLEDMQNHPTPWMCEGEEGSLPPPAPTYFTDGFMFRDMPITSLAGFSYLTSMPNLSLDNSQVTNLSGLEGLSSMMGLEFFGGPLNDISAISSLQEVSYLSFVEVPNLTSLSSLSNITQVESLDIYLTGLSSLQGLNNVSSVNQVLYIEDNSNLTTLDGLESLTTAGGVFVANNSNLQDIRALSNLGQAEMVDFEGSTGSIVNRMSEESAFCTAVSNGNIGMLQGASYNDVCEGEMVSEDGGSDGAGWVAFVNSQCHNSEQFETIEDVESIYLNCDNESFGALPDPEPVQLSGNFSFSHLSDITGLSYLNFIPNELNLSGNSIVDASPLNNLISINVLDMSSNSIEMLPVLSSLDNFGILDFSGNELLNLNGLPPINNPSGSLYFADNLIDSVTALINTTAIGYLDLQGNPLVDIEGLSNLRSGTVNLPDLMDGLQLSSYSDFCGAIRSGNVTLVSGSYSDVCEEAAEGE